MADRQSLLSQFLLRALVEGDALHKLPVGVLLLVRQQRVFARILSSAVAACTDSLIALEETAMWSSRWRSASRSTCALIIQSDALFYSPRLSHRGCGTLAIQRSMSKVCRNAVSAHDWQAHSLGLDIRSPSGGTIASQGLDPRTSISGDL